MPGVDSVLVALILQQAPAPMVPVAAFVPPTYVMALPCAGTEGAYSEIYGVCSDGRSAIYVCDYMDQRVYKFDLAGNTLGQWNSPGAHGVAVAATGEVYVSNNSLGRIEVYTGSGVRLREFSGSGTPFGPLYAPTYLCMTPEGTLLVSDSQNQRIVEFTPDGAPIRAWGGPGSLPGQFAGPRGIAMDAAEDILVCDEANRRVQVFSRTGAFLSQWPIPTHFTDGFVPVPRGISVDALGRIYVTDRLNARVDVFQATGIQLGQWGSYGLAPGQLLGPNAVQVDGQGIIYVGESNCHVQVFVADGFTTARRTTWGRLRTFYR